MKYFDKRAWDPYMDGIELRPRLYTLAEKLIFLVSMLLILISLLILILPGRRGVSGLQAERFWPLVSIEEGVGANRTFERSGEVVQLDGPLASDIDTFAEVWQINWSARADQAIMLYIGDADETNDSRDVRFLNGGETIDGMWFQDEEDKKSGGFFGRDRNISFQEIVVVMGDAYRRPVNYTLLLRMTSDQLHMKKVGHGLWLWLTLLVAGIAALATWFYNELFRLQRALMSLNYHYSRDLEPTGLHTVGHVIATVALLAAGFVCLIQYLIA